MVEGLRHLPWIGDQLTAVVDLATAAGSGTDAFADLLKVAHSVADSKMSAAAPGSRLLAVLAASSAPWTDAEAKLGPPLDRLKGDLNRPLLSPLAGQVRRAVDLLQPARDQASVGVIAARFAPAAIGRDQPQTYLVLLPNPSEIRPAGGFSGTVGALTMTGGAPSRIDVRSQELYTPLIQPATPIPYPLSRYFKFTSNALELGDAGWDPDFPTTARLSEQMFASATKQSVAGTISIDPYAIEAMLAVTGPVVVPGYGSFDAANFFYKLNYIVNASTGPGSGKGALGPISRTVLQHVLTAPASQWPRLFVVFQNQADSRHIQAYFHEPALAAAASQVHYDGAVIDSNHDYLMVADGNVGANKGDYFIHKSMDVKAEVLAGPGLIRHQVSLHYQMPIAQDPIDQALNPGAGDYRDYVRIYLPANATVADFKASSDDPAVKPGLDAINIEHDHQAVGVYFRLPRGHSLTLTLFYETPTTGADYRLFVQKQASVPQLPTTIAISYPGGVKTNQSTLTRDLDLRASW